jgi:vacuolar protein sorting-associated protein 16
MVTPAERIEMWVKCGMIKQAAEEAARLKNGKKLEELKQMATRPGDIAEVERLLSSLRR